MHCCSLNNLNQCAYLVMTENMHCTWYIISTYTTCDERHVVTNKANYTVQNVLDNTVPVCLGSHRHYVYMVALVQYNCGLILFSSAHIALSVEILIDYLSSQKVSSSSFCSGSSKSSKSAQSWLSFSMISSGTLEGNSNSTSSS